MGVGAGWVNHWYREVGTADLLEGLVQTAGRDDGESLYSKSDKRDLPMSSEDIIKK